MRVNGVETRALNDSGSAISVISETIFNKLRTPLYAWFGGLLRGADGKGIKPQGITKIIVSHEKGTHEIEVVVIKGANPDLLLGNDYSRKTGLNIDFGKQEPEMNIESVITTLNKMDIPDADMQDEKFELSDDDRNYLSNFRLGNVTTEEEIRICDFLKHFRDCFSFSMKEIGCVKCVKHRINTGDHNPINQPPYRSSPQERGIIDKTVKEMLDAGSIEPSLFAWASPVILVPKKGSDTPRMVVDYRKLNSITEPLVFPIINTEDFLFLLNGALKFAIMDPSKCEFALDKVNFLGYQIDKHGVLRDPERVRAIISMKAPTYTKGIKSF
ncbi:hypothetical protein B4U79_15624, partial [Dinothrombium tinctorium]